MQRHIQIRYQPVRAPSPDYACKNKSSTASIISNGNAKSMIVQQGALPAKLPILPFEIMKKRNAQQIKNQQDSFSVNNRESQRLKCQTKNGFNSTSFKIFNSEIEANQIYNKVREIYLMIAQSQQTNGNIGNQNNNYEQNELAQFEKCLQRLNFINQKIKQFLNDKGECIPKQHFESFGHEEELGYQPTTQKNKKLNEQKQQNKTQNSIFDSPIRKSIHIEEESQISLLQIQENNQNKYKRQFIPIKLQMQKTNNITQYGPISEQSSSISVSKNQITEKHTLKTLSSEKGLRAVSSLNYIEQLSMVSVSQTFLKQKIAYLQNELSNKVKKLLLLESQKNQNPQIVINHTLNVEQKEQEQRQNVEASKNTNTLKIAHNTNQKPQNMEGSAIEKVLKWQSKIIKLQQAVHEIKQSILACAIQNDAHQKPSITCKCFQLISNKFECKEHQKQIKLLHTQIQQTRCQNDKLKNQCFKREALNNSEITNLPKNQKKHSKRRKGIQKAPQKVRSHKDQIENDAYLSESALSQTLSQMLSKTNSVGEAFMDKMQGQSFINKSSIFL